MRFLYKYPQAAFPYARAGRGEPAARQAARRSSSCSTPASSTSNRYFDVEVEYAKADAEDILIRIQRHQPRARSRRDSICCRPSGSATPGRGSRTHRGRRSRAAAGRATPIIALDEPKYGQRWLHCGSHRDGASPTLLFTENETNTRAAVRRRRARRRTSRTRSTASSSTANATRSTRGSGTKAAAHYALTVAAGDTRHGAAAPQRPGARTRAPVRRRRSTTIVRRAASRGRRVLRHGASRRRCRPMRRASRARRSPGCSGRSSSTTTSSRTGSRATRRSRRRRRSGSAAATTSGRTSTTPTSSRCRTSGSTRGTRRGIWPSTACRWRSSIPTSPRSSCSLLLREWYMHPNGQLPAYEWALGDVNPPVHAWAAWRVYKIEQKRRGTGDRDVPRARLPEAAAQLHLVGEPQGRRRA